MPIKKTKSKILKIENLSKDTKKFIIEKPKDFNFKPGQYILLELEIQNKTQRRAFSICSTPNESSIELLIKKALPKSFVSKLFKLKTNSEIYFIGPVGKFLIDKKPKNNLVFISTGTGIAPFKSIIKFLLENQKFKKQINLIHGYRYKKDILYKKEFEELEKNFPNFKQYIILSKSNKNLPKEYVQNKIEELIKEPQKNKDYYICGLKEMVSQTILKLKSLGVNQENIFFEKYD